MAGGGKTTQTSTQQLQLPAWLNKGSEETFNAAKAAAAANPVTAYTGPMAAGSNANLDQASAAARQTGVGTSDLERARQLTEQGATAPVGRVSTQDFGNAEAARYMDPYVQQVQGRTLDEMRRQNAMAMQDLGDSAQGSKAYGGMRHAVLEGETAKGQNANMLDYLAKSNSDAYNDSYAKFAGDRSSRQGAESTNAGLDQGDASRALGAGGQMAGIGSQAQGMSQADIDELVKTGAIDQETANSLLGADYNEFLRMQDAPMQRYQQLMGMLTGAPTDRTTTGKDVTQQKNSLLSTMMGVGSIAASAFSDNRLKRDVTKIGEYAAGLGKYLFRYAFAPEFYVGTMADDVERVRPDAVSRAFGFRMVDYAKLGV